MWVSRLMWAVSAVHPKRDMEPELELLFSLIILAGMLVTLCGVLVPVFPALVVIWLLALLYGIISGFGTLGTVLFVVITVLLVRLTVVPLI